MLTDNRPDAPPLATRVMTFAVASAAAIAMTFLSAALVPSAALAAEPDNGAGPEVAEESGRPTGHGGQLEEIVVTATRHAENLSKVPISITALTQETMDEKGIKDFQDIVRYTPGVSIDTSGTNAISIRGISSSSGAGTTGIYIDDTPIQMRSVGFNPDDTLPKTFDLDRVEVLRGPQGTLFGAGSEGGTVRYILTQPKTSGSSTYLRSELAFTQYGQPSYEAGIAHGDTIVDGVLGYRASAWYRGDGGWINRFDPSTNQVSEHNVNRAGDLLLRLAAVWKANDAVTVTPSLLYQNTKKHDESTYWIAYSNPSAGDFNTGTPERNPVADEYYLPALRIEVDLGHSQIFSNSAYYHRHETTAYQGSVYDLSFFQSLGGPGSPYFSPTPAPGYISGCGSASTSPTPPCSWYPLLDANGLHLPAGFSHFQAPNTITNSQESWTQEIRWQSNDDASHWRWTVGAFWQLAKEGSIEELKANNVDGFFQALYGVTATSIFGPFYGCNGYGGYTAIPNCDIYYNSNTTFDRQIAGFGEVTYAFNDHWKLTLGERVARTSFSLNHYGDGLENFGPNPASAAERETPNTPKASVSWQMNDANLFYATYAKGFRGGGGNAPLPPYCANDLASEGYPNGAPLTYKSDSTQSYEIGSKNAFGRMIKIATSVYYIKWNDIQQNVFVGGACGLQFADNLGTAVSKGFDVQADVELGALHFDVAAGYNSARFTENSPHGGLASAGDAISGQAALEFSPGVNAPWTVAVGAEYDFTAVAHEAYVRFDWAYASRNPWPSTLQDPNSSQYNPNTYTLPATTFVQMRGGVNLGAWSAALFCDNLLNSHTVTNYQLAQVDPFRPGYDPTQPSSVQQNQYTFRPRTIGITATYRTH